MAQQTQALEQERGEGSSQQQQQQWRVSVKPPPLRQYWKTLVMLGVSAVGSVLLIPAVRLPTQPQWESSVLWWLLLLVALITLGFTLYELIDRSRSTWTLSLEDDDLVFTRGAKTLRLPLQEIAIFPGGLLRVKHPRGGFQVLVPPEAIPLVGELFERVVSGAETRIRRGGTLEGQGWWYDSTGLHWGASGSLPLSSLVAMAHSYFRLAFWRRGEARPAFVTDASGLNVPVLERLLMHRLPGRLPPAPEGEWMPSVYLAERARNQPGEVAPNFLLPGDAAGEHLRLRRGKYDASGHVFIAAIAQAVVAGSLAHWGQSNLLMELQVQPGAAEPLILPLCIAFGVLAAHFTFRDSWSCIEAVASRACSGNANISMLYVPIGAFAYANIRLVGKLFRGLQVLADKRARR